MTKKLFWGYVDYNQKVHIKRYKNDRAIRNAEESGTTIGIFDPFYADNIVEASHMILNKWREQNYFVKAGEPRIILQ